MHDRVTPDILRRLGAGERIEAICATQKWSRAQFDAWWQGECRARVPGEARLPSSIRIHRDRWGIPHVRAANDHDLFFGFGFATAQDRLFQLDYLRRKAKGTLAEVLGPEGVHTDILYRTIGLARIAQAEWQQLPEEARTLLQAYTDGINALIEASRGRLPIEFDLLGYEPEPWQPLDSLVIVGEFRWYLTGRFPVICIPEIAKRTLGRGPLYEAFLQGEEDAASVLWPGEYPADPQPTTVQRSSASSAGGPGSNNWVLAGQRTSTGLPLVANDPHIPFHAVSIWHEVVLQGGSFRVAGAALAGMPAVMIGRNRRVAWGITNNICSLRDLYQEKTDAGHPGCFLYDGKWEPAHEWDEAITVKGERTYRKRLRASRNGPIVDDILPAQTRGTGPVALKWVGAEYCGWLPSLLAMNRARDCQEFREAGRSWAAPTFNLVFADVEGHIGYQCVGRIPIRHDWDRGYRPGWDPRHQWRDFIPYEALPHLIDPPRGFVVTANNRTAPDDYPYPLSGTWSTGHRAQRIRVMIEANDKLSRADCQRMQLDVVSGRARMVTPPLVALLREDPDPRVRHAIQVLKDWDFVVSKESVAATLFNVFLVYWCRSVAAERFPAEQAAFVAANIGGLALRLLEADPVSWFERTPRTEAIGDAFRATLHELEQLLGPDLESWRWGRLHTLSQKHFLSGRGDLGMLLDKSSLPLDGDGHTVHSATPDASWSVWLGAGYRMVADLADPRAGLWSIEVGSASGHPGSPHYDDQITPWSAGELHYLALDDE